MLLLLVLSIGITSATSEDVIDIHRNLNNDELEQYFGVKQHHQVPKYHVTTITESSTHQTNTSALPRNILSLRVHDKIWNLDVIQDHSFLVAGHLFEYIGDNGTEYNIGTNIGKYMKGKMDGDENSHVMLHHSDDGISGTVRTSDNFYFIHPLPKRLKKENSDHIVYSMLDLHEEHPLKNLFGSKETKRRFRRMVKEQKKRKKKTMELLIAADYKMLKHYRQFGDDFLPTYMLAAGNILSGLFRDVSLSYPIDVVIVRSVIFASNKFQAKDMNELLSKFRQWCISDGVNNKDDSLPDHFDDAVLWSRSGCANGCKLEGLGYVGQVCGSYGVGVGKDRGLMSSITLAHELGHVLNVGHDHEYGCADAKNIMATGSTSGGGEALRWSSCASKAMEKMLLSSSSSCFDDEAITSIVQHPLSSRGTNITLYGTIYNTHSQCQFMYGKDYTTCRPYMHICARLYCHRRGTSYCVAISRPPAHGTECGRYKWCIHGACVPNGQHAPTPINGGWSQWGEYSSCTHNCSIGVQWRTRHCNNPEPRDGGLFCNPNARSKVPEKGHFRTCNVEKCPVPRSHISDGDNQCTRHKERSIFCYLCKPRRSCEIVCGSLYGGYSYGNMDDGSLCHTNNKDGICIQGQCRELDCKGSIETQYVFDRCKECAGNGTSCTKLSKTDTTIYRRNGAYELTTIPAGSFDLDIVELAPSMTFLGVKVGDAKHLAFYVPCQPKTMFIAGAKLQYIVRAFNWPDHIKITGKINQALHVYLMNRYAQPSTGVKWKGTLAVPSPFPEVKWSIANWSPCSKPCAGGTRTRLVDCLRTDDSTPVNPAACPSPAPAKEGSCNDHSCPPEWRIPKWTHCTRSCGHGNQTRYIFCGTLVKGGHYVKVSKEKCDVTLKPKEIESRGCNKVTCPAKWQIMSHFGACSTSCGLGKRIRKVECMRINEHGNNVKVHTLECSHRFKPATEDTCNIDEPCPQWEVVYGSCSVTCNTGVQNPEFVCRAVPGVHLSKSVCSAVPKPSLSAFKPKPCGMGPCGGFKWLKHEGSCSVTCGKGVLNTAVHCHNIDLNKYVSDSKCDPSKKPVTPQTCDRGICVEYIWRIRKEECSKTCGGGTMRYVPYCWENIEHISVDSRFCDISKKMMIKFDHCNSQPCPPYIWILQYSDCSKTCNKGHETGTPVCQNRANKNIVSYEKCANYQKLETTTRECNVGECEEYGHEWKVDDAGCNVTCGQGRHLYKYTCYRVYNDSSVAVDDPMYCINEAKPAMPEKTCKLTACVQAYKWNVTHSRCAKGCGRVEYTINSMQCIETSQQTVVYYKNCLNLTIPKLSECKPHHCKPVRNDTIPFYRVGCFYDNRWERRLPYYVGHLKGFDWYKTWKVIVACLMFAYSNGFPFFSLQNQMECWVGKAETQDVFFKDGEADNCHNGVGGGYSNYVYHIGAPLEMLILPPIAKVGCYLDQAVDRGSGAGTETLNGMSGKVKHHGSAMSLEEISILYKWDKERIALFLQSCGQTAFKKRYLYFAVDTHGQCIGEESAKKIMKLPEFDITCALMVKDRKQTYIFRFI